MNVSCPTCKCSLVWSTTNKSRPFCSEKCRLIDLGEWASGSYSIPEETKVPDTYDDM
ncbi:MAG: DNA gyrase inhibitor YacG [Francisellaceae bacterium]|nr:DNA gyrase inhibitor YacG [Francisellaceae bacterium]MBT6206972.1 DNA gyrase inhibitor YacG [Francisellaceae bacterium]MBT6539260.1 DNA gyrase inhibitor YacG [Francisellaceae bacterium]